jgi:ribosomal protein S2
VLALPEPFRYKAADKYARAGTEPPRCRKTSGGWLGTNGAVDQKIGIRELLEAGAHFGHQAGRWNPKMKKYIYNGPRRGIHIIDLSKTVTLFEAAYNYVVDTVGAGKPVLFVGTKKQAQEIFKEEATRAGQYFVTNRWLGGTLTNWRTIRKSVSHLRTIEKMQADGTINNLPKKEQLGLERERQKLEKNLGGIKDMDRMPGAVFLSTPRRSTSPFRRPGRWAFRWWPWSIPTATRMPSATSFRATTTRCGPFGCSPRASPTPAWRARRSPPTGSSTWRPWRLTSRTSR